MNSDLWRIKNVESFGFSAENPKGTRGGGTAKECDKPHPCVTLKPNETVTLAEIEGPGCFQHMWFGGEITRNFIIRIYWDHQMHPSVEAPLSAFCGWAYHENFKDSKGDYPCLNSSMIMVAPAQGCNIYFPMPFRKSAKITLENRGTENHLSFYMITGIRGEQPFDIGYFHASYRQEHPVTRGRAYNVIDGIKGQGQFIGVTLAVGVNGNSTCWVEGEARMYLDGEKTPTLHYTGTEDYFCGSFSFGNDNILHRYQPYNGLYAGLYAVIGDMNENYNTQQRFLLYRFHVPDPIHFQTEFRMTLDNLGWAGVRYDDYTSVAYWYQTLPSAPLKALPSDFEMIMK